MSKVLVTGAAGFIGFHLCKHLIELNYIVHGIDSLNEYYPSQLKIDRLNRIIDKDNFLFKSINICDKEALDDLFMTEKFDFVINLAAQAGVRYSIKEPYKYLDSNLIGFVNVLEACRNYPIKHLIYASSSSVYGNSNDIPFSTKDRTDEPVSLYAATKKANELLAHSYSHLYNIPMTGLRFFTVYGPYGRPDMAYFSFTKSILNGKSIKVFNNGNLERDFTYVDDIVLAIEKLINLPFDKNGEKEKPYRLFNIGSNKPIKLLDFIAKLENLLGKKATMDLIPMQNGDVYRTYADISDLEERINFKPNTKIEKGLKNFVDWYLTYYKQ